MAGEAGGQVYRDKRGQIKKNFQWKKGDKFIRSEGDKLTFSQRKKSFSKLVFNFVEPDEHGGRLSDV